jgi:hypothetical protein
VPPAGRPRQAAPGFPADAQERDSGPASLCAGRLASHAHADQHTAQPLEHDLIDEAAAVPALVHEQWLLVELAVELPHELLHAERIHVRQVYIGDLAADGLVDDRTVVIDPSLLAQRELVRHGLHDNVMPLLAVGATYVGGGDAIPEDKRVPGLDVRDEQVFYL